jgi:hypothetical protein
MEQDASAVNERVKRPEVSLHPFDRARDSWLVAHVDLDGQGLSSGGSDPLDRGLKPRSVHIEDADGEPVARQAFGGRAADPEGPPGDDRGP